MLAAGRKKSVMPDPDKTSGWHMHQKTPYKFNAGNGQFLPLSFFPVILNGKSNIFIIHMDDAVIADSDPMGILSKVMNHRLCTVKSFLTVRNPFCVITGIYKFFEFIMITVFFGLFMASTFFPVKRALNAHEGFVADMKINFRRFRVTVSKQCLNVLPFYAMFHQMGMQNYGGDSAGLPL